MANSRNVGNLLVQMRAELGGLKLDIKEMQSAFKGGFDGIANSAKAAGGAIAGALGVGFSVAAIVSFSKSVVSAAGNLKDLEQITGISAQTLSGLKATLEENGDSVDNFATAFGRLIKGLTAGDEESNKVVQRLKQIGFSAEELKNAFKDPEGFLEKFAKLLAENTTTTQRLGVAQEIAGRGGGRFAASLVQMADGFAKLKVSGMSQAQIDTLDQFGDSVTRLTNALQVLAATPLTNAANNLEAIARLFGLIPKTAAQNFGELESRVKGLTEAVSRTLGGEVGRVLQATNEELRAMAKTAPIATKLAISELLTARAAIQALLSKESIGSGPGPKPKPNLLPDLPSKKKAETAADSFLASLQKQTEALKVNIREQVSGADAAKNYGLELAFAAAMAEDLAKGNPIPANLKQRFADFVVQIDALSLEFREAKFQAEGFAAATKRGDQDMAELGQMGEQSARHVNELAEAFKKVREEWDKMRLGELGAAIDQDMAEISRMGDESLLEAERIANRMGPLWNDLAGSIRGAFDQTLSGILQGTQTWGEAMKNLMGNIGLSIANELQKAFIVNPLLKLLLGDKDSSGNLTGGLIGKGVNFLLGLIPKADDGLVIPGAIGAPQMVLAHGGETILPTHKTGGFGSITNIYHQDFRGAQRGVSIEVRRMIAMSHNAAVKESIGAVTTERYRSNNMAKAFK